MRLGRSGRRGEVEASDRYTVSAQQNHVALGEDSTLQSNGGNIGPNKKLVAKRRTDTARMRGMVVWVSHRTLFPQRSGRGVPVSRSEPMLTSLRHLLVATDEIGCLIGL